MASDDVPHVCCKRSMQHRALLLMQQLFAEFWGTFIFCLAIVLSSTTGVPTFESAGFILVALVYAFSHLSCHFNPAVTFGALLNGSVTPWMAVAMVTCQTAGGTLGGYSAGFLRSTILPSVIPENAGRAFMVEALYSFFLVLVMQNVGLVKHAREPNSYFGIAIGFVVLAGASAVGPISGGCFNPAIGMAIDATGVFDFTDIWIYWCAPFAGAAVATAYQSAMNWRGRGSKLTIPWFDVPVIVVTTEFIGVFFLTLTAALAPNPLAIGACLTALIYACDHVSAEFNPAVTVALDIRHGVWNPKRVLVKVFFQILGAFAASLMAFFVKPDETTVAFPIPNGAAGTIGAVAFECVWSSFFIFVILSTCTHIPGANERKGHAGSYHGLAIGFALTVGIFSASQEGAGSGGVFNPALGLGLLMANKVILGDSIDQAWVYIAGPMAGGIIGAFLFLLLHIVGHKDDDDAVEAAKVAAVLAAAEAEAANRGAAFAPHRSARAIMARQASRSPAYHAARSQSARPVRTRFALQEEGVAVVSASSVAAASSSSSGSFSSAAAVAAPLLPSQLLRSQVPLQPERPHRVEEAQHGVEEPQLPQQTPQHTPMPASPPIPPPSPRLLAGSPTVLV